MEERHRGEHLVAGTEHRVRRDDLLGEGVEVAVREDDALRRAGRAAGIEDHGRVARAALDAVVLIEAVARHVHELAPADDGRVLGDLLDLAPLGEHIARADGAGELVLDGGDDDVADLRVLADVLKLIIELVERDGRDGLGRVEIELDLLLGRERMDHVGDAADEVHRVEHEDRLRAVGHGDGDLVAGTDAQHLQALGAALNLLHHPPVRRGPAHERKGDVVRIGVCNVLDGLKHRPLKILQVHRHVAHIVLPGCFDFTHSRLPP